MLSKLWKWAGVMAALLSPAYAYAGRAPTPDSLQPVDCPAPIARSGTVTAECLRFATAQVPGDPSAGTVEIALMKVRVKGGAAGSVPVFLLHGGPGFPILSMMQDVLARAAPSDVRTLLGRREWVILDQRGVGQSTPSLRCREPEAGREMETVRACLRTLQQAGVRPNAYNSIAAAGDIDALRRTLGYEKIFLYGESYGSRLAYTYARLHPAHTAAIVYDGAMRPDNQETVDDAVGVEQVLGALIRREPGGMQLWRRFERRLAALNARPVQVRGQRVDGARVLGIVRGTMFGIDDKDLKVTVRAVTQVADGAIASLLADAERRDAVPRRGAGDPLRAFSLYQAISVDCNEEKSFETPAELARANARHGPVVRAYISGEEEQGAFAVCRMWPAGRAPAIENMPVVIDRPQLVLTGEFDPSLSRTAGRRIVQRSTLAREVVFANSGHVQFRLATMRCAMGMVHAFFDDPAGRLDVTCATRQAPLTARWIDWRP